MIRLCRQPSISTQGVGMEEAVQLVAETMQRYDLRTQILSPPRGGYPVVYGELPGGSPATLLFYNHYDVQPAEPLELWSSPPFEPRIHQGTLRARGVSDNKGNIIARLAAIRAYQAVHGRLPASVKFCIEGEEEIGSPNLASFVENNRQLLEADACIWEGGGVIGGVNWQGRPTISFGLKGILYVELEVRSALTDVHSSMATVVPNAAWRLIWALRSLKDQDENILIEGFYDDVRLPAPPEVKAAMAMPFEEEELRQSLGLKGFLKGLTGFDFRLRHLFQPTCTICGISSGYTAEGTKTVLPPLAKAKLDFRLVPDQRPEDILSKLRRHLDKHGFEDVTIAPATEGENPARTPLDSPFVKLVCDAAKNVYGVEPVVVPTMAASGPMFSFTDTLGLPTACLGVEYPGCRMHAPDENIRLSDFVNGIKHVAAILERFGTSAR